jgi:hypothetical protein
MPARHHLTRIDDGWWVRVQRHPRRISKFFADSKYGGNKGALQAATKTRDLFLAKHPQKAKAYRLCACGCKTKLRRRYPSGRLHPYAAGHRPAQ